MPSHPTKGFLYSILGVATLSCNYTAAKMALQDIGHNQIDGFNPETFTFLWMTAATIYSLMLVGAHGGLKCVVLRGRPLYWMLALGLANTASQYLMWNGLARIDPSFASLLGRFTPMMVILTGVFLFREHIRSIEWVAILVMLVGGVVSSLGGTWHAEWLGIVLTLGSTVFGAVQWVIGKHGSAGLRSLVMNFYRVWVPAVVACVWALMAHKLDFSHAHQKQWLAIVFGAFMGPFLSYVLIFRSYKYWDMSRAAIVLTLQPLFVIPSAYYFFHSLLTGFKLSGGMLILAGGLWLAALHKPAEEDLPPEDVPAAGDFPVITPEPIAVPEESIR